MSRVVAARCRIPSVPVRLRSRAPMTVTFKLNAPARKERPRSSKPRGSGSSPDGSTRSRGCLEGEIAVLQTVSPGAIPGSSTVARVSLACAVPWYGTVPGSIPGAGSVGRARRSSGHVPVRRHRRSVCKTGFEGSTPSRDSEAPSSIGRISRSQREEASSILAGVTTSSSRRICEHDPPKVVDRVRLSAGKPPTSWTEWLE